MDKETPAKKIVIVGNGFGGNYTLKNLRKIFKGEDRKKVHITLVGKENFFLFTPLLHEVATGSIRPGFITEPIKESLSGCYDFMCEGKCTMVNFEEQTVEIGSEKGTAKISYDYLVLAPGGVTNFYGIPEAEKYSLELKSLNDAKRIKNRCIAMMEAASHIKDAAERKKKLTFVVAGGGPTGVELAAELNEFLKEAFVQKYSRDITEDVSIIVVQRGPELIPQFGAKLRQKSLEFLERRGVKVMRNTGVKEVQAKKILLDCGTIIETENVFWVAGIKPMAIPFGPFAGNQEQPAKLPDGRIIVNQFLQLPAHKNVFVIGDAAAFTVKKNPDGTPVYALGLAQVAVKEAKNVAENIKRIIALQNEKEFFYHHLGNLVSLGHGMAVGQIYFFAIAGHLTWYFWRIVYLAKVISWRKKKEILFEWTTNIFKQRNIDPIELPRSESV